MKQKLINKDILVAEIEERRDSLLSLSESCPANTAAKSGFYAQAQTLEGIKNFIDTLEVKEDVVHGTVDYPLIGCDFPNIYPNYKELKEYCDRNGIKDNDKVKLIIIKDM